MLLKNNAKRLITINGVIDSDTGAYTQSFQIMPGDHPAVEVPDELIDDVVLGWINAGDLIVTVEEEPKRKPGRPPRSDAE